VSPTPPRLAPPAPAASPYANDDPSPLPDAAGELHEADACVLAIPPPAIAGLLDAELRVDPFFERVARIRTKRTIACQLYFDRDVSADGPEEMVVGTPDPFSAVLDRRRLWTQPDGDPLSHGSVLVFVGEEDSMHGASDAALVAEAERLACAIYPGARGAVVTRRFFHRSAGDPYFHTPRGSDALRPTVATPLPDLLLAGDFTANGFDVVGMEGAVVSGFLAANLLLRRWGHPPRPILPMSPPGGFVEALRGALATMGLFRAFTGYAESPC
jgi:isorenieratene synthase